MEVIRFMKGKYMFNSSLLMIFMVLTAQVFGEDINAIKRFSCFPTTKEKISELDWESGQKVGAYSLSISYIRKKPSIEVAKAEVQSCLEKFSQLDPKYEVVGNAWYYKNKLNDQTEEQIPIAGHDGYVFYSPKSRSIMIGKFSK